MEEGLIQLNTNVNTFSGQECKIEYESLPTGTLLLLTLEQLACGASLIECMAAASVPSTLAKCLYIFLDLPPSESSELSKTRLLFQCKFTGLLQKICVSAFAAEELVQADALRHLFSASVDPCSSENACWRRNSCKILTTLAQNSLTPLVIQYIHDSGCIAECIENLRQMRLPKRDVMETFTSLFHVLSESSRSSTQLLDDFHACGAYSAFTELLLKVELEESEEAKKFCQQLCRILGDLVFIGSQEIRPRGSSVVEIFQLPGFVGHLPKAKSKLSLLIPV
ncbi:unnamed protein product [Schistocephalus solidus]|uniref:Uncharacterized protein n=1 Tax=Schistocephalus solidus TaxID=70667 RepID=A0A3P7E4M9_SCHSO|nr:unnamed protein product [Schistocephalus solidus]